MAEQRLIDANELTDIELAKNIVIKYGFCGDCRWAFGSADCAKYDCYKYVKQLMDAKPVVHGTWIITKNNSTETTFACSVCGRGVTVGNAYYGMPPEHVTYYYPYCHCGADMREGGVET